MDAETLFAKIDPWFARVHFPEFPLELKLGKKSANDIIL